MESFLRMKFIHLRSRLDNVGFISSLEPNIPERMCDSDFLVKLSIQNLIKTSLKLNSSKYE